MTWHELDLVMLGSQNSTESPIATETVHTASTAGASVMQTLFCNAYYNTGLSEVHALLVDMLRFEIWKPIIYKG